MLKGKISFQSVVALLREYLKPHNFDKPRNNTQTRRQRKKMEKQDIALCDITNPSEKWTNEKCTVSVQEHKESIASCKSEKSSNENCRDLRILISLVEKIYRSVGKCSAKIKETVT